MATAILTLNPDLLSFFTMAPPSSQLPKLKNLGVILQSFLSLPLLRPSVSKYLSNAFYVPRAILDTEKTTS